MAAYQSKCLQAYDIFRIQKQKPMKLIVSWIHATEKYIDSA